MNLKEISRQKKILLLYQPTFVTRTYTHSQSWLIRLPLSFRASHLFVAFVLMFFLFFSFCFCIVWLKRAFVVFSRNTGANLFSLSTSFRNFPQRNYVTELLRVCFSCHELLIQGCLFYRPLLESWHTKIFLWHNVLNFTTWYIK